MTIPLEKTKAILKGGSHDSLKVDVIKIKPPPQITIGSWTNNEIYKKSSLIDKIDGDIYIVYEYSHNSPEKPKVLNAKVDWNR